MKLKIMLFAAGLLVSAFSQLSAQNILHKNTSTLPTLSLHDAIELALKNNYDIRIVKNDLSVAQNNVNVGNAGFLPTLDGNFSNGGSIQNTVQTPSTGAQRKLNGVRNTNEDMGL